MQSCSTICQAHLLSLDHPPDGSCSWDIYDASDTLQIHVCGCIFWTKPFWRFYIGALDSPSNSASYMSVSARCDHYYRSYKMQKVLIILAIFCLLCLAIHAICEKTGSRAICFLDAELFYNMSSTFVVTWPSSGRKLFLRYIRCEWYLANTRLRLYLLNKAVLEVLHRRIGFAIKFCIIYVSFSPLRPLLQKL